MHVSRRSFLAATATSLPAPLLAACAASPIRRPPDPPKLSNPMRVGFAISEGFNVMDMAGPWETFQDTMVGSEMPFQLCTVGPSREVVEGTGGLRVQPTVTYEDASQLDIVVVGAQKGGPELHAFLRAQASKARLVMSVCTGAFQLARAGLFVGKSATTHHDYYEKFAAEFPSVRLVRHVRFVDEGSICSSAGIASGIHLALHLVKRTCGEDVADATARYMEFINGERV
jgi:transcriptional regulator GlxA family with amidase domain